MLRPTAFLLSMSCLPILIGCDSSAGTAPYDASKASLTPGRQKFGEFSFEIPDGWSTTVPDRDKTKAMILLGGTRWDLAKGMIKVDVGTPAFPTSRAMAENVAQGSRGQVAPNAIDVDGEEGVQITMSSTSLAKPQSMIIVYRGGKAYLIIAGGVEGVDVRDAVERVRTTWKWAN